MDPVETTETNFTFTLPGGTEENDLPVKVSSVEDEIPTMTSFWKLDKDDMITLDEGGYIELTIEGLGHPPVRLRCLSNSDVSEPQ